MIKDVIGHKTEGSSGSDPSGEPSCFAWAGGGSGEVAKADKNLSVTSWSLRGLLLPKALGRKVHVRIGRDPIVLLEGSQQRFSVQFGKASGRQVLVLLPLLT
jgi:hypothetical protein